MGAAFRYLEANTYWWEPYMWMGLMGLTILWGVLLFATDPEIQDMYREMRRKR